MDSYPVVADYIDKYQFSFPCPFCSCRHLHGNVRDFCRTRYEYRQSHCRNYKGEFKILICKETKRMLNESDMEKYNNYVNGLN